MRFKRSISLFFVAATFILLGVSLVIHALLYAGFNTRDQSPLVWNCLQYVIVVGFIPKAVNWLSRQLGITKPPPPYVWGSASYEEHSSLEIYLEVAVGVTIVLFCLYAIMNPIYWYVERLQQWHPYAIDGQYFAYFKGVGNKMRTLTAEEYKVMSLYFARAASSHWAACHSLALVLLYGD